jgi:hypothetical protein
MYAVPCKFRHLFSTVRANSYKPHPSQISIQFPIQFPLETQKLYCSPQFATGAKTPTDIGYSRTLLTKSEVNACLASIQ